MFLINMIIFWGAIFFLEFSITVNFYFLFLLLFGFLIWYFEGNGNNLYFRGKIILIQRNRIWLKLWILTLIPVIAQVVMINKMGGIEGYVVSMLLRVKQWEGLGIYIVLIRSILVINLIYFILIVKVDQVSTKEKILFFLNLLIFVTLALLTSSRSTLFVNFFLMFIIYFYYVKSIKLIKFFILSISIVVMVLILGVARNGYSFKDGQFSTGLSNKDDSQILEAANFNYGLFPLVKVTESKEITYYYGKTYLSAITNLIPRSIWPEKPDTGGVRFTKDYHDVHNGYSNYSTGIIVEGIMNFGFFLGAIISFFILLFIYAWFFKYSYKKRVFLKLRTAVIYFAIYPNLLFILPTFLHGEFTTVVHSIFINKVLLIILFVKFIIPSEVYYIDNFNKN